MAASSTWQDCRINGSIASINTSIASTKARIASIDGSSSEKTGPTRLVSGCATALARCISTSTFVDDPKADAPDTTESCEDGYRASIQSCARSMRVDHTLGQYRTSHSTGVGR
eukprot:193116-Rhodomonas_salina.8